jgi:hypothetical protein
MAEKGETKIMAIITICVILLSISFSGCVGDDEKDDDNNYKFNNRFRIQILTDIIDNYTLIVPVPIEWNNIVEDIRITSGYGEIREINSTFGRGLEINSSESMELEAIHRSNTKLKTSYRITLYNNENGTAKVFCKKFPKNSSLHVSFVSEYSISNGGSKIRFNEDLNNGWNYLKVNLIEID